ncbi:MAG: pseudouridine synthase [Pseudomonadota bacterium]
MRISAYLSRAGYASRREAERLIEDRLVYINGKNIDTPVAFVEEGDFVRVGSKQIKLQESKLWMYNKPKGEMVGVANELDIKTGKVSVFDNVKKFITSRHIIPIGRLDINSEGLLLFTNDGNIAQQMMQPKNNYARKYVVKVVGDKKGFDKLKEYAINGVIIAGIKYKSFKIKLSKKNNSDSKYFWYEITLFEGKNREVRKIFTYVGLKVLRLIRIQFGKYRLGNLASGEVVKID